MRATRYRTGRKWLNHMIFFPIELHQSRFEVLADGIKNGLEIAQDLLGEYGPAIFGYKDQMHVQVENTVSILARR